MQMKNISEALVLPVTFASHIFDLISLCRQFIFSPTQPVLPVAHLYLFTCFTRVNILINSQSSHHPGPTSVKNLTFSIFSLSSSFSFNFVSYRPSNRSAFLTL